MASPHDEPAYEGRISGRISADIREPRSESVLGTRKLGWDIQSDPRGYPTDIVDKNLDLDETSYGPVRGPSYATTPRPSVVQRTQAVGALLEQVRYAARLLCFFPKRF